MRQLFLAACCTMAISPALLADNGYPEARQGDASTDFHGTVVADPFRWLEDASADETRSFIDAQNTLFTSYVNADLVETINARLNTLIDYPRTSLPSRVGKPDTDGTGIEGRGIQTFVSKNTGLQNHSVLHIAGPATDGETVPLLDPNSWSDDGTTALAGTWASPDGTTIAYGISEGGSDNRTIKLMDLRPGKLGEHYDEVLTDMRFSGIAWHRTGRGFWYSKYPDAADVDGARLNQTIYWHELDTDPEQDTKVFARPDDPELGLFPFKTNDGQFLVVYVYRGTDRRSGLHVRDACCNPGEAGEFELLFEPGVAEYSVVDDPTVTTDEGEKPMLVILTNRDAPAGKLVRVDPANPEPENWVTLIDEPTEPGTQIEAVVRAGDRYVVELMKDARSELLHYDLEGGDMKVIELPTVGTVAGIDADAAYGDIHFGFTSYTYPTTPFRYELATGELTKIADNSPAGFDPDAYETSQVFYTSKDGTKVPMFITHKKGLQPDGDAPTILYGYGGFNVSLTPGFSSARLAWLEQGGVYAVANLRGGGEYGPAWHEAGKLANKQNVFDDFIAAAEYLIDEGFTSADKLAIQGGSNGGLLTAAVVIQRPELFGAVHSAVPVTDMLRYHTFGTGRFWTVEYGNPDEDAEAFEYLMAYSPLNNARLLDDLPPVLVTTGDGDDRVVPAHSLKWVAAMQAANPDAAGPVLLRYDVGTGHGAGKPLAKALEELAETYAFFAEALGMDWQ
ncbi:MAG: prolyl oligopeptidase family serine peptidase [Planctomycetota bacterium]